MSFDYGYGKGDYSKTYWCSRGNHENLGDLIDKLIPPAGEVENKGKNRSLERYRKARNCYYDLYNNGLGNRASEFNKVFGFGFYNEMKWKGLTQKMIDRTEQRMDQFIQRAFKEQVRLGNISIEDAI